MSILTLFIKNDHDMSTHGVGNVHLDDDHTNGNEMHSHANDVRHAKVCL